jgi:hypothetical protein
MQIYNIAIGKESKKLGKTGRSKGVKGVCMITQNWYLLVKTVVCWKINDKVQLHANISKNQTLPKSHK